MRSKYLTIGILLCCFFTILFAQVPPNDPYYTNSKQWNLSKINIEEAWNVTTGSTSIKIAIIGNGVELNHSDIRDNICDNYNAIDPNDDANPSSYDYYHETAIAGIAGATTNNARGIAGVAYNCRIMPILFRNSSFNLGGDPDILANAVNWAVANGADVINLSWGITQNSNIDNAINNAVTNGRNGNGCIFVTTAGNNSSSLHYPGTRSDVITVGGTNQNDEKYSDSGTGDELDIMAPTGVPALDRTDVDGNCSGDFDEETAKTTSYAAPHIAGVAALMLSANNSLTHTQVKEILYHTAKDLDTDGWDSSTGWGRVDAGKAVKSAARQFTTSGQLSDDEYWWGNVNLSGDVSINSNNSMFIIMNTNISLNSHKLVLNGDNISYKSGASLTVIPNIQQKNGTSILAYHPSIYSALSDATNGDIIKVFDDWSLSTDLVIPSGVILEIESGATLDLNSHTIATTGGSIVINGTIEPNIRLQSGSTIKGLYPSISTAFTNSTSGQSVRIKGTISLSDNLSIPTGKILYTETGTLLQFAPSKYLTVLGTLNANNTTFTSTGTWWGIKYYSTSSGSMTNCTINNATCGTWISGSSPTIQSNTYSNVFSNLEMQQVPEKNAAVN